MLRLRMLGGFEVWVGDTPAKCPVAPGRLLCRLAVDANRPLSRGSLWQELWPDSLSSDVLDATLGRLRNGVLGAEGVRLRSEGSMVFLDLTGADVDFLRFQELVEAGSISDLAEAVQLYRGEFLKRYIEDGWVVDLRDELKTDFEDALKTLAEHALIEDQFLVAARYLRRFVESNPEYEWGWHKLLETYARYGNRTEAMTVYAAYLDYIQIGEMPVSKRIEELMAGVRSEEPSPLEEKLRTPFTPPARLDERLTAGGALPSSSSFYVERREDSEVANALSTPGVTVRIKGARQTGKSSLLARALRPCREAGCLVLLTDWQSLSHEALGSAEGFFTALAHKLADQAKLDADPTSVFRPGRTPGDNFDNFIHRLLIPAVDRPIIWAIDEADRIFGCDFRDDVFGKMRAWHNERALDPDSPWARISLVLTYSTEARLFIKNLHQSPFNVGSVVELNDFSLKQSLELNEQYGGPLSRAEAERLYRLVSGHPYLTSRALYEMKRRGLTMEELETCADQPDGPFHEHLERLGFTLRLNPELAEAVRASLQEQAVPTAEQFLRLHAAGVMTGSEPTQMRPRCSLYERYLRQALT